MKNTENLLIHQEWYTKQNKSIQNILYETKEDNRY